MSLPSLPELIFHPEGPKLDVKQQPWNLDTDGGKAEFIKDVSAMANSAGEEVGHIILGVTDAERTVVGVDRGLLEEERLQQIVAEYIDPPFALSFTMRSLLGQSVGVISVPLSRQKPHLINRDIGKLRQGTCYVRRGSITALARSSDIRKMVEEVLGAPTVEDAVSEHKWSRGDIEQLDHLASAVLWAFVKTGRTELSLREIEDHCSDELTGKKSTGRVLAGKLKTFHSKHSREPLIELNVRTGKWRFDDSYRSFAASVLREKGFF
jgi:predicted HTH transcriptional regulator